MAVLRTVPDQHHSLSGPCLSTCHDPAWKRQLCQRLYRIYLHPSYVDELPAAYHGMADFIRAKWCDQRYLSLASPAKTEPDQHTGSHCPWNGIQLPSIHGTAHLQRTCKIDDNTINAAKDLGANTFQTLFYIWLPLSLPGIISGITMVFVPSLTTFVISDLLGGSKILLIGNVIEQEFTKGNNWHLGSGLSLVLMVFILISMAMIAKYDKNGEGTAF